MLSTTAHASGDNLPRIQLPWSNSGFAVGKKRNRGECHFANRLTGRARSARHRGPRRASRLARAANRRADQPGPRHHPDIETEQQVANDRAAGTQMRCHGTAQQTGQQNSAGERRPWHRIQNRDDECHHPETDYDALGKSQLHSRFYSHVKRQYPDNTVKKRNTTTTVLRNRPAQRIFVRLKSAGVGCMVFRLLTSNAADQGVAARAHGCPVAPGADMSGRGCVTLPCRVAILTMRNVNGAWACPMPAWIRRRCRVTAPCPAAMRGACSQPCNDHRCMPHQNLGGVRMDCRMAGP